MVLHPGFKYCAYLPSINYYTLLSIGYLSGCLKVMINPPSNIELPSTISDKYIRYIEK